MRCGLVVERRCFCLPTQLRHHHGKAAERNAAIGRKLARNSDVQHHERAISMFSCHMTSVALVEKACTLLHTERDAHS
jgi:hypothetical protein